MNKIPTYGIYNPSVNTQSQVAQFPFNYSFNQPSTYWWKPSNVRNGEMWGQGSEANPVLLPEITVTYNKSKYDSCKQSYKERLKERQRELKRLGLYKGRFGYTFSC